MSIRNLSVLLGPGSIALIGGSNRKGSLGKIVLDNVIGGGFTGRIDVVNPHRVDRPGTHWAGSIDQLSAPPDIAVVMTPAKTVPSIVRSLGALGTKCAVVLSAGITERNGLRQQMLDEARPHLLRIVGPNCLGVMSPRSKLDATFARTEAEPGGLALISQSGALITAMLDWAHTRGIGFSSIVSVGEMADVDIGDLLDLYATDPSTKAILLYIEGVTNPAKFLSAARAAAINKPVVAIKAGRSASAAEAAFSHTGALAGSYDVYLAAFERCGIVVVDTLAELLDAAQTLSMCKVPAGGRLAIVTNGGGAGILAVDALGTTSARIAELTPETLSRLNGALPGNWSRGNPVDLVGDAGPERYGPAIEAVLADRGVDALLVMNCPTATADSKDFAAAVAQAVTRARAGGLRKPVLACWLGDGNAMDARQVMTDARIPLYASPEDAVTGFGHLLTARTARSALLDRPTASRTVTRDIAGAKRIIDEIRADRLELSEVEAKELLSVYGVPVAATRFVEKAEDAAAACRSLNAPFAVKIVSPDITHKTDVGGVALGLLTPQAVENAAREMADLIARDRPEARLTGFAIEEMVDRPHAYELLAGIATDATFGPLLMVGAGGTAVEVLADRAIALPPIDHAEALALIDRTAIARRLRGFRNVPPAAVDKVADVLDALAAMTIDLPDIAELDINPLLVDAAGVVALDARIRLTAEPQTASRLMIRPVPVQWSADLLTRGGVGIHVRPVRPDDEASLAELFRHVSPEDLRFRFLGGIACVTHDQLAPMTRVDYRRKITFLAFEQGGGKLLAAAMLAADPDRTRAEVAMATRADAKSAGVSWTLLEHVLRYAKAERIEKVVAVEYADHDAALRMERELGFSITSDPEDATLRIATRAL